MNNFEIERKFLVVDDSYKQMAINHYTILQGYICRDPERTIRVRMRRNSNGKEEAFLTIKGKSSEDGLKRFEWEKSISPNDAQALLQLCHGSIIEKTRWMIPVIDSALYWEVDEFHGQKEGLTLAEIELSVEDQPFELPPFIGEEVTGHAQYYNSNM